MSNLFKSGFVAFSQNDKLVIDANKHKIITGIDAAIEEAAIREQTMEEALAEALIQDAGLNEEDFDDDPVLAVDTAEFSKASSREFHQMTKEIVKSAKEEAEMIISQAHDEVEQLRSAAYDEVEQLKEQAKEEGFQQGYEEGRQTAEKELKAKTKELEERAAETEHALQQKEEDMIRMTEQRMVDWLCRMIPQITGVVVENQREVLLYMVNSAMQDLDNSKHFVIRVSGGDYEKIEKHKDEIYGALNPNIDLEVFEDAKLSPLQCVIETDNGMVDISLDVQLDNLVKALRLMVKE